MSGLSTGPINESSLDRHVGDAKGWCIQMKGYGIPRAGAGSQRETFGAALRRYLTERDVTPSQLAQRTDYGKSHLPSRLECASPLVLSVVPTSHSTSRVLVVLVRLEVVRLMGTRRTIVYHAAVFGRVDCLSCQDERVGFSHAVLQLAEKALDSDVATETSAQ
jgi:hypothetical protein